MYKVPDKSPISGMSWGEYVRHFNGPQKRTSCLTLVRACEGGFLTPEEAFLARLDANLPTMVADCMAVSKPLVSHQGRPAERVKPRSQSWSAMLEEAEKEGYRKAKKYLDDSGYFKS